MAALFSDPRIVSYIELVEGQTEDEKLLSLLETYLTAQIRACEAEIGQYEVKYRATFEQFAAAWERGGIPNKHAHAVERDYMEWEGLVAEKQRWLERLRDLPRFEAQAPAAK